MRFAPLAIVFLVTGCFTAVTDPNYWNISSGQFSQFLTESDLCTEQASYPLQPEMENAPLDDDAYRSCMLGFGWTERE